MWAIEGERCSKLGKKLNKVKTRWMRDESRFAFFVSVQLRSFLLFVTTPRFGRLALSRLSDR